MNRLGLLVILLLLIMSCDFHYYTQVVDKWEEPEQVLLSDQNGSIILDGKTYDIVYDLVDDYDYCVRINDKGYEYILYVDKVMYDSYEINGKYDLYQMIYSDYEDEHIRRVKEVE